MEIKKETSGVSLEEAIARIERYTRPLTAVTLPLTEVQGEILSGDVLAVHDQPPFPRSPLDGYALRGEDSQGATVEHPVTLKVIDKFCAGECRAMELQAGECVRIMTGAPIPTGANAVIRQEDTDYGVDEVQLYRSVAPWQNYCYAGEDYHQGDLLLSDGAILDFAAIGVLASNGIADVTVYPKPKVAVISTGDELLNLGEPLQDGKIYDSNLYMIQARLREWGMDSTGIQVTDQQEAIKQKILESLAEVDAVITTGGVSVGEKDLLNQILQEPEMNLIFSSVKMKPGSPVKYALYQGKPILALSGNPFAAMATLELLAKPMLGTLMQKGHKQIRTTAVLKNGFQKASKGRRLIRAAYENGLVRIPDGHSSGQIFSMIGCNCLVDIPGGTAALQAGSTVEVILL